jgi:hypothetical protein
VIQNSVGMGWAGYTNARKKVPERRSGLCSSEKELAGQHSGAFCHKNTPPYNCGDYFGFYNKFQALFCKLNMIILEILE